MGRGSSKAGKSSRGGTPSVVSKLTNGSTYDRSGGAEVIQLSKADRGNKSLTDNLRAQGFQVSGQLATRTSSTGSKTRARTATALGKMTGDQRAKYLNDAPVGTQIKGLYSKRSGREVTIEKKESYKTGWGIDGSVGRRKSTYWAFNGSEEPYASSEIRKAFDGTSNYYTTKKKK